MEIQLVETLALIVHCAAALTIIGLVLVQQGKGAEMGSGFGGGASNTVFGSGGSGNFLTRMTTTIAVVFFVTSFGLAFFAKQHSVQARNVGIPVVQEGSAPAEAAGSANERAGDLEIPTVDSEESEVPQN